MRILFSCGLLALLPIAAHAQVGVGTTTPDAKSALDIRASDKGLLIPRLTAAQRTGILNPPQGLMVYQTDGTASGGPQTGFWYYAGTGGWVFVEPAVADNLGNHTATQNLNLTDKLLVGGTAAAPGTQGLKVDAAGRVGIGLATGASPTEQLHVDGGNAKIGLARWTTATDDRLLKFGDGSFVSVGETGGDDLLQFQAKDFRFNASGRSYTGNVGIGLGAAVAPSERLEVGGNVKITGTAGTDGLVFPDGTKQTTAAAGSGGLTLPYSGTATASSSVFQITNSGSGSGLRGASASGQGVVGRVNGTGAGQGVVGVKGTTVPSVEDAGVVGLSEADYGIYGRSSQSTGIYGISDGTSPTLAGVLGVSSGGGAGVQGTSVSNSGVYGVSTANNTSVAGVQGIGNSGSGIGVLGTATSGFGVRGVATGNGGHGINGVATGTAGYGVAGSGSGGATGVYGSATGNARAGYFQQTDNTSNQPAVEITQAGSGPALKLSGAVTTPHTGIVNMLPVAYGRVQTTFGNNGNVGAAKVSGSSNWTVIRLAAGAYLITFTSPNLISVSDNELVVQLTVISFSGGHTATFVPYGLTGSISVLTGIYIPGTGSVAMDDDFCFTVYKQ